MEVSVAVVLRTLFLVFGCFMAATIIYSLAAHNPFRREVFTPWMMTTTVDFTINAIAIGTWVIYKESNLIVGIFLTLLILFFGSFITFFYIVVQFFKLTPQESNQDPIYFVLLRDPKRERVERVQRVQQKWSFSAIAARVLFSTLGLLMIGLLLYTLIKHGSPFHKGVLTWWLGVTLLDFYFHVLILSVWIVYKESSWIWAFVWIILLICLGSIGTCLYIVLQLFRLPADDPAHLILFNSKSREHIRGSNST